MKLEQLGYKYIRFDKSRGQHLLMDLQTKNLEWWAASKHFAGFSLPYKNTDLEFCSSADPNEAPF